MIGRKGQHIVVGLDIGTTKICAIIGEAKSDGVIDVIGVGTHPSRGLKKGVVVNIDSTVESIRQAVEDAQIMAGVDVGSVYVGIAGGHVMGLNSTGIIAVKNQEITAREIDKVIEAARVVALPMDREVIHVLPQEFIVDDHHGILDPVGMSGVRLEARVHIVTAAVASAHNIVKCVNKADLEVADIVLEQLASSEAVLTPDERELGVIIIDIGGGSTNIALISGHGVKHTAVLGVGGNHITNDLAFGLHTTLPEAERWANVNRSGARAWTCAILSSHASRNCCTWSCRRLSRRVMPRAPLQGSCSPAVRRCCPVLSSSPKRYFGSRRAAGYPPALAAWWIW
jgi:cell division protein FtsA